VSGGLYDLRRFRRLGVIITALPLRSVAAIVDQAAAGGFPIPLLGFGYAKDPWDQTRNLGLVLQ
jgi:hypothetical protein